MKIVQQWGLVALVGLSACQTPAPVETNPQTGIKYQPELALQDLFHDVQMSGIFLTRKLWWIVSQCPPPGYIG